jgi:hypothetical protein
MDHPKILKRIVRLGTDIITGIEYGANEQWPEIARLGY